MRNRSRFVYVANTIILASLPYCGGLLMLRNQNDRLKGIPVFKLLSLSAVFLLQTACGGGDDSNSESSALGIQDVAIAYVKHPTPRDDQGDLVTNDIRRPGAFVEGGDLYLQARATSSANIKNITRRITNGLGDVKDVSASYDGNKLLFSLRLEDIPNDGETPSWNLYEYDITADTLTQLTQRSLPTSINEDDIAPHYLPSGDIIFSSNRQIESKGIRNNEGQGNFTSTDENHRTPVFLLHVRNKDDGKITQISFNESHDLDPTILKDSGRVLFSRWNNVGSRNDISLYSMNPDGTDVKMYYGSHSHFTGQDPGSNDAHFTKVREMDDGRLVSILRPLVTNFGGGDIVFIDAKNFADNTQPTWAQQGAVTGNAQTNFKQNITNSNGIALQGRYNAIFPMLDGSNRYLMSWSACQILSDPLDTNSAAIPCSIAGALLNAANVTEAPPAYGIYLVDANSKAPLVLPEKDIIYSEIVMAYAKKMPPVIYTSAMIDTDLRDKGIGALHIRSVYDFDKEFMAYGAETSLTNKDNNETPPVKVTIDNIAKMADPINTTSADERPARFIRIIKSAYIPTRDVKRIDNDAYGVTAQNGMREIIGYAPIEPDGSVKIKIPANVPLSLSILDKEGRRISNRHQYWFQVKPGETLECTGCHIHRTAQADMASNKPHGRMNTTYSLNQGATEDLKGFPNSNNSLYAFVSETMAEARARLNDCAPNLPPCDVMKVSTDLIYDDVWTDDVAALRSADASFTIDYSSVPLSPASAACANNYGDTPDFLYCRIVINYEQHIEAVWSAARPSGTCISCHNKATNDAAIAIATNNPASYQLELTSDTVNDTPFYNSFKELTTDVPKYISDGMGGFIIEQRQVTVGGVAQFNLLPDGSPDLSSPILENVMRDSTIKTSGALTSYFMEKMTNTELKVTNRSLGDFTQTVVHTGFLNASELKLISEWLDIGAQYFNNPIDPSVQTN